MKPFIIRNSTDPLAELEAQQESLVDDILIRLQLPHEKILPVYEADFARQYSKLESKLESKLKEDEEETKEKQLAALQRHEMQFREAYETELRVIQSLCKQMIHITAAEIKTRKPSQVQCEYKGNLFVMQIRYKGGDRQ